ncbi:MAG: arsenate reductase ArsC [Methanocalculus sp. MSAO_Arc1]|uniref:arsenate reductase ArsC n=1 Tax=Methanocalculus TaxID=71151 RepID=UPI000FF6AAED|nr:MULTISPECIES: arsenate reductase ArsC [unclassified Methanocalculus]MCP1662949.1 arsenate reductase [Methanocalculus sp. AMF5]RQD81472.1 MAG: arsenate reductase ArsC [Methanocalculus sp. MSAO_Arc1]
MKKILFICTHNAGRSQIAEGYLNSRYNDSYQAFSAGSEPASQVNPLVIRAMQEIGIDLQDTRPKLIDEFDGVEMDILVTLCDSGTCPLFPWAKETIHQTFPDPKAITGTDEEILAGIRTIRDGITDWIDKTFGHV